MDGADTRIKVEVTGPDRTVAHLETDIHFAGDD
jgi:hypothetical protein